jgi:hypothetical protein
VVGINIRWEYAQVILPALIDVAVRHQIVLYDPQKDEIPLPTRLNPGNGRPTPG